MDFMFLAQPELLLNFFLPSTSTTSSVKWPYVDAIANSSAMAGKLILPQNLLTDFDSFAFLKVY